MGAREIFYSSFLLLILVESSSGSVKTWFAHLGGTTANFSWPVFSASIFVFIGLVLSTSKVSYSYGVGEHPFPVNWCLKEWKLDPEFYNAVKIGIVQNMILKMICAFLAMILESFGVNGEAKFEWRYGCPYLAVILNFSQTWALYCLVQVYSVTKEKLAPINPLAKFLTFKSIVFLTWWQGVAIAFLFLVGAFRGSLAQELKTRIQDYIICIEVCEAKLCIAHCW